MAKETPAKGAKQEAKEEKEPYTTFRIFAVDGEDLSELADKRNTTIAKLYRQLFAKKVREMLIEETKDRLRRLEGRD